MTNAQGYAELFEAVEARNLEAVQKRTIAAAIVQMINEPEFMDLAAMGHWCFAFQVPEVIGLTDETVDELIKARKEKANQYENVRLATKAEITQAEACEIPVIKTGHNGKWLIFTY
ncbi:MAG: hypothetical protein AAB444_01355 [Patescibacteria group bacterium]